MLNGSHLTGKVSLGGKEMTARDLVGYGPTPPVVEWPDNARIALKRIGTADAKQAVTAYEKHRF